MIVVAILAVSAALWFVLGFLAALAWGRVAKNRDELDEPPLAGDIPFMRQ